ncbi:MAG: CNNM domain-containing protein [Spartobacteria bacterium]
MIIFAIICCWTVSFFFNGIESGLLSVDAVRLRENVKRRVRPALRLNRLLKKPERLLVTVLLITNAVDIVGLLLLTRQFVSRYGNAGFLFALLMALPIYLFLLGVLPKALFRRFPFRALALLAGVLEFVTFALWPLLELGARVGGLLSPRRAERGRLFAAREELKHITAQSEREGSLTSTERAMIHNVVDFRGVRVRDVMVAKDNVITVSTDTPLNDAIALSAAAGFDRVPVIAPGGQATGLVNILDVLLERNETNSLGHFTRRVVTAREDEPAYRIVQRLRAARQGLAAVLDGEQKLRGIVTIEDLVRRLVSSTESRA